MLGLYTPALAQALAQRCLCGKPCLLTSLSNGLFLIGIQ